MKDLPPQTGEELPGDLSKIALGLDGLANSLTKQGLSLDRISLTVFDSDNNRGAGCSLSKGKGSDDTGEGGKKSLHIYQIDSKEQFFRKIYEDDDDSK
uniref:Uncharacterized protein n=1 Tax=Candidatus Kentrum sp. FM TaxID=2126340 RepID=A0A450TJS7_9GAMM|nr:MAG: hypothetical protein BECKFM1743C_GA0114222_104642 [Candidatus Kentron sp. FM]VFJ68598.1 MAG: hypothetical protein BECKFM1743A_GA0114220_104772 [Candidatus Kentron sp. FM]VFK17668.1 MAG: hypothetical protein BECKFM1743B_GA0114221_104962 [Candidatus Kentron sp. FM]